jgi:hypothetical protein
MGYNTPILVLNDRLNEIKDDPYFGPKLVHAIHSFQRGEPPPYLTGQTTVLNVAHADELQILAVGANTGRLIGRGHWTHGRMDDDALITHLYETMMERKKHDPGTKR